MTIPHTTLTGVKEDSTYRITAVLKDEAGVAIPQADLTTVKMWLKHSDGTVINSRSDVDINNTGPATIDSSGNLVLVLTPDDNPFLGSGVVETHILTIEWTWNAGASKSHAEIHLKVENSTHVPTS